MYGLHRAMLVCSALSGSTRTHGRQQHWGGVLYQGVSVVRTLGDKLVAQCHSLTVSGRAESASIDAVVHVAGLCVNQEDVNAPSVYLTSASFCDSSPLSICPPLRLYFETWRSEPQG